MTDPNIPIDFSKVDGIYTNLDVAHTIVPSPQNPEMEKAKNSIKSLEAMFHYGKNLKDDPVVSMKNVPQTEWMFWEQITLDFPSILFYLRSLEARNARLEIEQKSLLEMNEAQRVMLCDAQKKNALLEEDWKGMKEAHQRIDDEGSRDGEYHSASISHEVLLSLKCK